MNLLTEFLTKELQAGYTGPNWIDIALKKTIDGIDTAVAFRKPGIAAHSIAEIICHVITWRKALMAVLKGREDWTVDQEGSFNTSIYGKTDAEGWQKIKSELDQTQHQLLTLLQQLSDKNLGVIVPNRKYDTAYFIKGIIQHDAYHLGQIVLLAK